MVRRKDWAIWKEIQRAMDGDGMHVSDRLLREAAAEWEVRKEWPVIRALLLDAKRKGVRARELFHERG